MNTIPLDNIFEIKYGNQLDFEKMLSDDNGVNFISRSSKNFGIAGKVAINPLYVPFPKGTITVTLGGTYLLASFIQPDKYYTAQNVKVLIPLVDLTYNEKLYYCLCIQSNRFRYSSHGREANTSLNSLLVPDRTSIPEWVNAVSEIKLNDIPIDVKQLDLSINDWEYFFLEDLFFITGSKTTPVTKLEQYGTGIYPYVTTQATNNGIAGFYNYFTEGGNVLTIDSAVLGYCSYQELDFSASDHVEKLVPKFPMNKYSGMFLKTIINREQYRYSYGRKASQDRLKKARIKLPSKDGQPDFDFMETYIKTLPYSSTL